MEVVIMSSLFRLAADIAKDEHPWGNSHWISHPGSTGAEQIVVLRGTFLPSQGHAFHIHPDQEEVIFVVSGEVEQWIDREKRMLGPGDAVFVPPGVIHGTYNVGSTDATVLAILGPCAGFAIETVDMANVAPWDQMRAV
jgi:quercetin dioxygenase-like cupin family protein